MDESALARVEAQRMELENNIAKLRKSLRHWQTLEIDYQGLSEEFVARPESLSKIDSLEIAKNYGADLVDEKELREILNYDKGVPRKPEQVIELLSKRVEYVDRNIETIKKQLTDAQKKLNALLLAEQPEFRDEAGLPLTEITEELDEDGKVISSKVQRADESSPQLVNVLKKAGVQGVAQLGDTVVAEQDTNGEKPSSSDLSSNSTPHNSADQTFATSAVTGVTKRETTLAVSATDLSGDSPEEAALRSEMLDYHDGLGEMGAIVAELDLEDGDVSYDEEEEGFSADSDYDEDDDLEDDTEDDKGMSRSALNSGAYLRKMKQLEKKHGITGMSNIGPQADLTTQTTSLVDRPPPAEAARKAALARAAAAAKSEGSNTQNVQAEPAKSKGKKKVAFAKTLDIAPEDSSVADPTKETPKAPILLSAPPLKQTIVERPAKESAEDIEPSTKKVSRFKAARLVTPQTPLFAPPPSERPFPSSTTPADEITQPIPTATSRTHEPIIIEHPSSSSPAPAPGTAPDAFGIDSALHQREIATEYHQLRNRMIQRQGGFVGEGEQGNWGEATAPLYADDIGEGGAGGMEEDGMEPRRKVSRFKAARMK